MTMELAVVSLVTAIVGIGVGGFLGYRYGQSVQEKAQAMEQAAATEIKRVL